MGMPAGVLRFLEDALFVLLVGLLVGGHFIALAAFPFYFIARMFAAGASGARQTQRGLSHARSSFFDQPTRFQLKRVSISELLPSKLLEQIEFKPSFARGFSGVFKTEIVQFRVYQVVPVSPPLPTEWRAYPSRMATQFVFLLEEPKRLSAHGKFRLFHEMHHVSPQSAGETTARLLDVVMLPVLVWAIYVLIRHQPLSLPIQLGTVALVALYALWQIFYARILSVFLSELRADQFAVVHLPDYETRLEVLGVCSRVWGRLIEARKGSYLQRLEWRLRLAAMRRAINRENDSLHAITIWQAVKDHNWRAALSARALLRLGKKRTNELGPYGKVLLPFISGSVFVVVWTFNAAFFFIGVSATSFPNALFFGLLVLSIVAAFSARFEIKKALKEMSCAEEKLIELNLVGVRYISKKNGRRKRTD